ncbi:MAG: fibrobacter succinogenes major paralogous domain-containing protein [Alistipes sp.]|nr:fibrobacter succinogenes major paralogous domain-containing protein [Alistipes senegalensis]MCM1250666.1 fibrobacter succinogenes major paralogous domain-containing protein [Alistipes sp.]
MLHTPASGYRQYGTGALTTVGTQGDFWSSSPADASGANAGGMWFDTGNIKPLGGTERAYGFTVRCVQHLRTVFQDKKK